MKIYHRKYKPHTGQVRLHKSPARFRIGSMGRRWGKTTCAVNDLVKEGLRIKGIYWWVAPTYTLSMIAWRKLLEETPRGIIKNIIKSEHMIQLVNGTYIYFKSADAPDRLVGEGLRGIVVDEAARCKQEIWDYNLRPTLSDLRGWAVFIGTPKSHNWFHTMYLRGRDPNELDYESFTFPSSDNPYLPEGEIEEAKRQIPENAFRQEYLAEFIADGAGVFRGIRDCILSGNGIINATPWFKKYPNNTIPKDERYLAGIDLGRTHDYTVLTIIDSKRDVVYFDRFTGINWALQKKRIATACKKYNNAQGLADKTGLGNAVVEDLHKQMRVKGFNFTHQSKEDIINSLSITIEEKLIRFPEIEQMVSELDAYDYEVSPTGKYTYGAPTGYYDDCVISLALANWQFTTAYRLKRHGREMANVIY